MEQLKAYGRYFDFFFFFHSGSTIITFGLTASGIDPRLVRSQHSDCQCILLMKMCPKLVMANLILLEILVNHNVCSIVGLAHRGRIIQ